MIVASNPLLLICICRLSLSPSPSIQGGVGLGFLSTAAAKYQGSEGKGMPNAQGKITFLRKVVLTCHRGEDSSSKIETFGYFPRGKSPQNYFGTAKAKVRHNSIEIEDAKNGFSELRE